jgi:hypothetical protein
MDAEPLAEKGIIAAMQRWLDRAVIGLNLCPFAKAVSVKRQIRWVVSSARSEPGLTRDLIAELNFLAGADPAEVDTTLIIHPLVLQDFRDYNDYLAVAESTVAQLELEGVLQVASFHPGYQFADSGPDDIENYTNRSPYPALHLLREDSVTRAVQAFPDAASIFENNMETLRALGHGGWKRLWTDDSPD